VEAINIEVWNGIDDIPFRESRLFNAPPCSGPTPACSLRTGIDTD
jgi:hypothetical protein